MRATQRIGALNAFESAGDARPASLRLRPKTGARCIRAAYALAR